jgi:hypothetical protein
VPTGHVAALDPYLSGERGPRAHAGLKSWDPLAKGPDVKRGGPEPSYGVSSIRRGQGPAYGGPDDIRRGPGPTY